MLITESNTTIDLYDDLRNDWPQERDAILDTAKMIPVCTSDEDVRTIREVNSVIRDLIKRVHDTRMKYTRALDGYKKQYIRLENELTEKLCAEEKRLSMLATDYLTRKVNSLNAAANETAEAESILTGEMVPVETQKAGRRTVTFTVIEPNAVPRAYCEPSDKLIREYIASVKSTNPDYNERAFAMPGVVFKMEYKV